MGSPDVVDTAEEAEGLELAPLIVREPLEEFLDAQRARLGPSSSAERIGEGHSNITYLVDARRRALRAAPPAAPAAAAVAPTTCCASGACSTRSRTRRCARRARCSPATTSP